MILQILIHTPLWVWGLLGALLVLGWLQSRPRSVSPVRLLALPLALLALGLWSMWPGFAKQPPAAALWLISLGAFVALGLRLPTPAQARWQAELQRLQLPGSWFPMGLIVVIFLMRYVFGVAQAMHPELRGQLAVQAPVAAIFGALTGVFLGRALGLLKLTRSATAAAGMPGAQDVTA
jgi:hypothetical protein